MAEENGRERRIGKHNDEMKHLRVNEIAERQRDLMIKANKNINNTSGLHLYCTLKTLVW